MICFSWHNLWVYLLLPLRQPKIVFFLCMILKILPLFLFLFYRYHRCMHRIHVNWKINRHRVNINPLLVQTKTFNAILYGRWFFPFSQKHLKASHTLIFLTIPNFLQNPKILIYCHSEDFCFWSVKLPIDERVKGKNYPQTICRAQNIHLNV